MVNTGERLKTLRIENGLTQKQVAERVGVAVSAISSYEGGIRLPSYGVLIKLSKLYHVTTDFLLGAEKRVMPCFICIKNSYFIRFFKKIFIHVFT